MKKTALLLTSMTLALLLACGVVLAETVNCGPFSTSSAPCLGTSGSDTLYGTPNADYIQGQGRNDKFYGFEGADFFGGDQSDRPALDGNDKVYAGPGRDMIAGLWGGADVARGQSGPDQIHLADDDIYVGPEGTVLVLRDTPNPGVDTAFGGGGADSFYAVDGFRDVIDCGSSSLDFVRFDEGIDEVTNCERLEPATLPSP